MERPTLSELTKCVCVIERRLFLSKLPLRNVPASQPAYYIFALPVGLGVSKGKNEMMSSCESTWQQRQLAGWV